jgi:hypothetical protein
LGKEVATYFVDGTGTLTIAQAGVGQDITITDDTPLPGTPYTASIKVSNGTALASAAGGTNLGDDQAWCVNLKNDDGKQKNYKYAADTGLVAGTC